MKIQDLLVKAGCKPELVSSIVDTLAQYKETVREDFDRDFKARLEQAKRVCVEETEEHKRELARRLQIFCETKSAGIEASVAKQAAMNESKAVAKLNMLANALHGYQMNSSANGLSPAALGKAQRKLQQVSEDKKKAQEVANRQTAIAEKALSENRRLSAQVQQLQRQLVENKQVQVNKQRLDESRRAAKPVTTRPTLVESQDRRPARKQPSAINRPAGISDIANSMDQDLV